MNRHRATRTHIAPADRVGPDLVLALARQIPTLDTDALARVLAANLPRSQSSAHRSRS